jgi:hypothetical protein
LIGVGYWDWLIAAGIAAVKLSTISALCKHSKHALKNNLFTQAWLDKNKCSRIYI